MNDDDKKQAYKNFINHFRSELGGEFEVKRTIGGTERTFKFTIQKGLELFAIGLSNFLKLNENNALEFDQTAVLDQWHDEVYEKLVITQTEWLSIVMEVSTTGQNFFAVCASTKKLIDAGDYTLSPLLPYGIMTFNEGEIIGE
jgi:predicted nucleotide-binding protein (sugar kinase/HSP70/actin superfamily)